MNVRQHLLKRKINDGLQFITCWLEVDKRVRVGSVISLKGDPNRWEVVYIYAVTITIDDIKTNWGLKLPKSQRTER